MKKIALAIPNFHWQESDPGMFWHVIPYNLCLLSAMIRDMCDIRIIDANADGLSHTEFQERLAQYSPDVVGITIMMDQFAPSGHQAAALARQALPQVVTIMGGVYATINYDRAVADVNVDYVFRGEGEYGLRQFLEYLWLDGKFPEKGLVWRAKSLYAPQGLESLRRSLPDVEGDVFVQDRADPVKDLNALPLPAYDLVDYARYSSNAPRSSADAPTLFPFARIQTSRGCPQGCCFCQVKEISGNRFRPRSPDKILDEIAWLKETYGIRSLLFDDDNIVTQRSRAVALFRGMVERGLDMPWKAIAMAVFKLDTELLDLMAASGCRFIDVAIESGSPRVLKEVIRKPVDLQHAVNMVRYARQLGIYVAANFIIGFPTETWAEIRQSLRFAEKLEADYVKIFTAIPLRHTRLWEMCERLKAFKPGFSVKNISWNSGQIVSPHFSPEELTILRAYEWDRINFSSEEKCRRTAEMMRISVERLDEIRRATRDAALASLRH